MCIRDSIHHELAAHERAASQRRSGTLWSAARVAKDANMTFEKLAMTHVPPGLVGRDSLPKLFKEYKFNIDFLVYRNKDKLSEGAVITIPHYSE